MNFRVHWRPFSTVSLMGRYDYQLSTFNGFADAETGSTAAHILSGTVNWSPVNYLYVQVGASYSFENTFETPAATAAGATNPVPNLDNGYLTANITVGYALDELTDLTLGYTIYKADNHVDNSQWSQPFGASDEQHTASVTLARQFTKQIRGSIKYSYFRNRDDASGGNNDYDGHLIYATMQYRF
jgi:predicted porin